MNLDQAMENGIAPWRDPIGEDNHVKIFLDKYPVAPGHRLYVPKANDPYAIWHAFRIAQEDGDTMRRQGLVDGYNIGINQGEAAGQTVMYPHVHLIPRRKGDCEDPVGGVRGVIAGQANYRKSGYQQP